MLVHIRKYKVIDIVVRGKLKGSAVTRLITMRLQVGQKLCKAVVVSKFLRHT